VLTVAERIDNGITLLDTNIVGWADHIDINNFNISNGDNCILGQIGRKKFNMPAIDLKNENISSPYVSMCAKLGISWDDQENYGFFSWKPVEHIALNEIWKDKIKARQAEAEDIQWASLAKENSY
jgi:hypothetical protein